MRNLGIVLDKSSRQHLLIPFTRYSPGTLGTWALFLLVTHLTVALSQTSSPAPSSVSPATAEPTSGVFYSIDISVHAAASKTQPDVKDWLLPVFQSKIMRCLLPSALKTTVNYPHSSVITEAVQNDTSFTNATNYTDASTESMTSALSVTSAGSPISPSIEDMDLDGWWKNDTSSLFQAMEVSCQSQTSITNTTCHVMLNLSLRISPCCILQTICGASKNFSDMFVVGNTAQITNPLQNECVNPPEEQNSCRYTGQQPWQCEESESSYVISGSNSTDCEADTPTCDCSAYCDGKEAFYTFSVTLKRQSANFSQVLSLVSQLHETCFTNLTKECSSASNSSVFKDANVVCQGPFSNNSKTNQTCTVVVGFAHKVRICRLHQAVKGIFGSEKQIKYNGDVKRAAICGKSLIGTDLRSAQLILDVTNTSRPPNFCAEAHKYDNPTCENGSYVVMPLDEQCVAASETSNTTTPQSSSNVTSTSASSEPTTAPSYNTTENNETTVPSYNTTENNETAAPSYNTTENNETTSTANIPSISTATPLTVSTNSSGSGDSAQTTTAADAAESEARVLLELTKDISKLSSNEIDKLVSVLEKLLSGPTVSLALGNLSVNIVSNLLGASPEKLSNSARRIIGIVDTVGFKLIVGENPNSVENLLASSLALSVKRANGANFQEAFFSISDPSNVQVREGQGKTRIGTSGSSVAQGSVTLPASLTTNLTAEEKKQASRVHFNFYQKSTVFQDSSLGQRKLNSGILGASVANLSIKGLQNNVVIRLRNTNPVPANYVTTCVFWNFTFNNGSGGWDSNGCFTHNSTDNETVCSCSHLTSFAILLDLSRQPVISRTQATILTFITYIGCGISAIFLAITLLTYLVFGKLRKDIPAKILIHLCFALLLLNLVFLVDAWLALYPNAVGLCISTAWFLHYFLLVCFTWMGLEGVHMYLALVKVFNSHISHYMLRFSAVGWGVPMVVVIIVIAIDKNNYGVVSYGKFTDGTTDDFCWLKNDIAFYVAVVAYFCVIFLFNLVMFIIVMVQLNRIKRQNPHNNQHRNTMQDVRSVVGITTLLGLTWGFAFFAWGPVNLAFMYLFAIFNSLQGFFIFVFHCAAKESVRKQWRIHLCCGKMRLPENSEWSRTGTQKTTKNSLSKVASLHSSHLSRANNSPSSSFLISNSDRTSGIGSPFDDHVITADEDPSMDVVLNEISRQHRVHED